MSESRHAYLVLAHQNWNQLQQLLRLLDHPLNDIFLHIDSLQRGWVASAFQGAVQQGTLVLSSTRHPAWGSETLIDVTLDLLSAAAATPHAYYHLISGMDLPLRTQSEIHAFFSHAGNAEFIDFKAETVSNELLRDRLQTYHLFQSARERFPFIRTLDNVSLRFQSALRVNRLRRCSVQFQKGSQWFSITQYFAVYCLQHARDYRPYFRFSKCGDELFFQTILQNSPFLGKRAIRSFDDERATMRLIDWDRGNSSSPFVFRAADYDAILQSGMLFARKFDESVDPVIVERIVANVLAQRAREPGAPKPGPDVSAPSAAGEAAHA